MWIITIDTTKCKGDGDCANICPVSILGLKDTDGGKFSMVVGNPDDCIGCMSCVTECKEDAISVQEV